MPPRKPTSFLAAYWCGAHHFGARTLAQIAKTNDVGKLNKAYKNNGLYRWCGNCCKWSINQFDFACNRGRANKICTIFTRGSVALKSWLNEQLDGLLLGLYCATRF
jgi:hypothetical protein